MPGTQNRFSGPSYSAVPPGIKPLTQALVRTAHAACTVFLIRLPKADTLHAYPRGLRQNVLRLSRRRAKGAHSESRSQKGCRQPSSGPFLHTAILSFHSGLRSRFRFALIIHQMGRTEKHYPPRPKRRRAVPCRNLLCHPE